MLEVVPQPKVDALDIISSCITPLTHYHLWCPKVTWSLHKLMGIYMGY